MDTDDQNCEKQPRQPVVIRDCQYDLPDGKCGQRTVARGYCSKHYRVLNRRGAFSSQRSHTLAPATTEKGIDRNMAALRRAREKLEQAAPEFAEHIKTASRVAAQKGDSRPAEWGLLHSRAIASLSGEKDELGKQPIINIGVKISGVRD
jgi:hypothetical protein